jgi:hemerythrin-like domain-containing protein
MKTTELLSAEHRLIERVLYSLETATWLLSLEETVQPEFFLEAADFITGFTDEVHHKKEEDLLFKKLIENGINKEGNYITPMVHEHEMARAYNRDMRLASERLEIGDRTVRPAVLHNARHYTSLLRHHIGAEDQFIYPLADHFLPLEQQEALWQEVLTFDQSDKEKGLHLKFQVLASKLEKEMDI